MLTLVNCTLSGNLAQGGAGGSNGIYSEGSGQAADGGSGYGGAIFNEGGSVAILASTVAGNTVVAGAAGIGYNGSYDGNPGAADAGGVYNHASTPTTSNPTCKARPSTFPG